MTFGWENAQSLLGLIVIVLVCWALSEARGRFPWRLVIGATVLQAAIVMALFGLPGAHAALDGFSRAVDGLTSASAAGTQFVFGYLAGGPQPYPVSNAGAQFIFAFQVLPLILVVSAISAVLWHFGVLTMLVRVFGLLFEKSMGLRGAEALSVALNVFLGNIETPLVIKAWLNRLTRAELFLMMVVGLSSVAGSVMAAYALILKPVVPDAAGHVLAASVLSAPAGVALARIMIPETADAPGTLDEQPQMKYDGWLDAVVKGVSDGLNVALNVGAVLLVCVALVALIDQILNLFPTVAGAPITLDRIFGLILTPLAWLMGAPWREAPEAARLLGIKLTRTEFVSFLQLGQGNDGLSVRTRILLTYALCGFANFATVGTTALGVSVLVPERRNEVLGLVWKALFAAFLANVMSGAVVGTLPMALISR
ncbi:MAG TPA: nucleoside transporter C-terminal domain-containing protein [Caulobacteraceae bacterium]|nr:nucleoside transporter C-terminal domain-containing protein [Caulobacteraceae bacterium]